MDYQTIIINEIPHGISITINRLENQNTLNAALITELTNVICSTENNSSLRFIILKGQQGIFCTGMDFKEMSQLDLGSNTAEEFAEHYMGLLKQLASSSKIIISEINGKVMAGGIGLVAASDIVIATPRSQFSLSEALWGLLPANVLPYLIRRTGFQPAYFMTLTTQTIFAEEAKVLHLVDEVTEQTDEALRKHLIRCSRLSEQTVKDLKNYFRKLWIINENVEKLAVMELARLVQEPRVKNNIIKFIQEGKFPWEATHE